MAQTIGAPKGHKKIGGRVACVPNKFTRSAREAFEYAFNDIGGKKALAKWAKKNQTDFYKLFVRITPNEVDVTSDGKAFVFTIGGTDTNTES